MASRLAARRCSTARRASRARISSSGPRATTRVAHRPPSGAVRLSATGAIFHRPMRVKAHWAPSLSLVAPLVAVAARNGWRVRRGWQCFRSRFRAAGLPRPRAGGAGRALRPIRSGCPPRAGEEVVHGLQLLRHRSSWSPTERARRSSAIRADRAHLAAAGTALVRDGWLCGHLPVRAPLLRG